MFAPHKWQLCTGSIFLIPCNEVIATCPMFDHIEAEGAELTIYENTRFPETPEYDAWWRALPPCSALNQGRAIYRVVENRVYLTGFEACGRQTRRPSQLYPGKGDNLPALWLSGRLDAYGGKPVCMPMCPIYETRVTLELMAGEVVSVSKGPNPDVEKLCPKR